jgi:hypothetical protein
LAGPVGSTALAAQETAPLILRLPASPRGFSLGDAFVGGRGPDVVFYNPAQIGEQIGLLATVSRYRNASTQGGVAASTGLGRHSLAVLAQWLDYGTDGFPTRPGGLTERGPRDGQSLMGGLALATRVMKFRIGATVKYVEERIDSEHDGTVAFDLGLSREIRRLRVGLVAQHIGSDIQLGNRTAELPTRVTLGASTRVWPIAAYFDFFATAAVSRERDGRIVPAGGVELIYEPVMGWTGSLRLGARRVDQSGSTGLQPITVGASVGLDRFRLDYGFESYRGPGAVHRFGIRIQ